MSYVCPDLDGKVGSDFGVKKLYSEDESANTNEEYHQKTTTDEEPI
jgi:hypothetical protein